MDWFLYDRELIGNFAENVLHVSERNIAKRSISLRRERQRERETERAVIIFLSNISIYFPDCRKIHLPKPVLHYSVMLKKLLTEEKC